MAKWRWWRSGVNDEVAFTARWRKWRGINRGLHQQNLRGGGGGVDIRKPELNEKTFETLLLHLCPARWTPLVRDTSKCFIKHTMATA